MAKRVTRHTCIWSVLAIAWVFYACTFTYLQRRWWADINAYECGLRARNDGFMSAIHRLTQERPRFGDGLERSPDGTRFRGTMEEVVQSLFAGHEPQPRERKATPDGGTRVVWPDHRRGLTWWFEFDAGNSWFSYGVQELTPLPVKPPLPRWIERAEPLRAFFIG